MKEERSELVPEHASMRPAANFTTGQHPRRHRYGRSWWTPTGSWQPIRRLENKSQTQSGFTIVELLVVVAIIGLIIALLLPAINAAREAARKTQCQSNLRQVGISMINYLDVNKQFPDAAVMPTRDPEKQSLTDFFLPFAENNEAIFRCPNDFVYFDRGERISYWYNDKNANRTRTQLQPLRDVTVLFDYDNFHGPDREEGSRHLLYADGHVSPL